MAKCPWCNTEDMDVKGNAFANADIYGNKNLVVTECCDKPVTITPVRKFRVEKYHGSETEDDWGNTITRPVDFSLLKRGDWFPKIKRKIAYISTNGTDRIFVLSDGSVWRVDVQGNPTRIEGAVR